MKKRLQASQMFPVMPFSAKGEKMLRNLRRAFLPLYWLKRKSWNKPLKNFEENPRVSPYLGAAYLGYKYYMAPPVEAQGNLKEHFRNQTLRFQPDIDFIPQQRVSISVGGDLMPYERINSNATKHLWDEVGDWFFGSDIVVANLETPINEGKPASLVPEVMLNDMHFNGSGEMFDIFSGNGRQYDVLSTANNHSLDQGEEGLLKTLDFLQKRGVLHTGTNKTANEVPPILERNGIKIAFLAWTANLNKFLPTEGREWMVNYERLNKPEADLSKLIRQVKWVKELGADMVMLLLHAGNAYQAYPSAHTVEIYHRIFRECGIDVILGSHPHNPQPMEEITFNDPWSGETKRGFAIYSLADFVAYDIFVWDRLIPLLKLTIEKGQQQGKVKTLLTNVQVLPVYNWGTKVEHTGPEEMRFLDLKKTVRLIEDGLKPDFLSDICVEELRHLNWFCDELFLPREANHLLASSERPLVTRKFSQS
ncbi:MAG: CapA family protein [Siphonobacter sp.]